MAAPPSFPPLSSLLIAPRSSLSRAVGPHALLTACRMDDAEACFILSNRFEVDRIAAVRPSPFPASPSVSLSVCHHEFTSLATTSALTVCVSVWVFLFLKINQKTSSFVQLGLSTTWKKSFGKVLLCLSCATIGCAT